MLSERRRGTLDYAQAMARADIDRRAMSALSTGHMAVDFAGGVLPALLPFLVEEWDLSYTYAGGLILASALASSVVQPVFGLWSDRRGAVWLLPAGVAIGGIGMALAALSPSYWWVVLFVVVSGLGTAAYHPEGSKFAAYVSGARRASGMSLFSIGGNLGYSLGVIVTTPLVVALGTDGASLVVIPCLVVAAVLLWLVPFLMSFAPARGREARAAAGEDRAGAMALLLGVVTVRSVAWFGLITFVPLWEVSIGNSEGYGNLLLSIMLLAGAAGTLLAGPAADRFGRRPVLLVSNAVIPPAIALFILVGGPLGAAALVVIGASVVGTFGVTMVMSQEYMPRHIGMASGLSIGLSIGLGGIAAVLLGAIADSVDLEAALWVCAAAPIAGIVLTLLLPPTRTSARLAPEVASP
jgi:MFS transporter, FSR family, fosmidomycin resistance protein